jgi:hypothetical protein
MPAQESTTPSAQGAFRPRLIPNEDAQVDAVRVDLEHQRMVEAALRTQYAHLKQSFEALMDTHRIQFSDLTDLRAQNDQLNPLADEVAELQEALRAARESETATTLKLVETEARVTKGEQLRTQLEGQHLRHLNARSQAALERVRELGDLRSDLEIARRDARRVKRELTVAVAAERALEAYSDRLEQKLNKPQDRA